MPRSRLSRLALGLGLAAALVVGPAALASSQGLRETLAPEAVLVRLSAYAHSALEAAEASAQFLLARANADWQAATRAPREAYAVLRALAGYSSTPPAVVAASPAPAEAPALADAMSPAEPAAAPPAPAPLALPLPGLSVEASGLREAYAAYKDGKLAEGDALAAKNTDPLARTALEWAALRLAPRDVGFDRLVAFANAHPDWPSKKWLKARAEEALAADKRDPAQAVAWFTTQPPETAFGKLAFAKALVATGNPDAATPIVRALWRDDPCAGRIEAAVLEHFGDRLTRDDHKARADRLLYKGETAAALRAAALAGPDVVALAKARAAIIDEAASDKLVAAVPKELADDPGLLLAKATKLRRAGKVTDAAAVLSYAPKDPAALVEPDVWWTERRVLARKLLDKGEPRLALKVVEDARPQSRENKVEAAFHAGWIALRFLNDPARAATAFADLASVAETPLSKSRAAYWRGRAAEAAGDTAAAAGFYEQAGIDSSTFYGQLARARIGRTDVPVRRVEAPAPAEAVPESVRVVAVLEALGARDLALGLALDTARRLDDPRQIATLAAATEAAKDARTTLVVGKAAAQRGFALDDVAFPTFGLPDFKPLAGSAAREIVYAIARQESAFQTKAVSGAGARGLMQMIPPTARRTAQKAGVPFDADRLTSDPAFNVQLGAAHLGELLQENDGSLILTFAAYNAGARRVREWIAAYGDPRKPGVDAIDWIERIPFTETRNYVQRVMENVAVYKARFAEAATPAPSTPAKAAVANRD